MIGRLCEFMIPVVAFHSCYLLGMQISKCLGKVAWQRHGFHHHVYFLWHSGDVTEFSYESLFLTFHMAGSTCGRAWSGFRIRKVCFINCRCRRYGQWRFPIFPPCSKSTSTPFSFGYHPWSNNVVGFAGCFRVGLLHWRTIWPRVTSAQKSQYLDQIVIDGFKSPGCHDCPAWADLQVRRRSEVLLTSVCPCRLFVFSRLSVLVSGAHQGGQFVDISILLRNK